MAAKVSTLIDVQSKVIAVTVYESKAQVHRAAKVKLAKGDSTLIFDDIPNAIDRDSIQVSLRPVAEGVPPGSCILNGIVFDTIDRDVNKARSTEKATPEQVAEWETKLAAKKKQLDQLRVDQQITTEENRMVSEYFAAAVGNRGNEPANVYTNVAMWKALLDEKITSDQSMFLKTQQYEKDAAALLAEIEALGRAIAGAGSTGGGRKSTTMVKVVKVHLEATSDVGEMEVLVSYMVTNAAWQAAYDIRVDPSRGTANITYHAVVRQWTEEDWDDVAVTISTAKPAVSGRAPDLTPWYAHVTAAGVTNQQRRARASSSVSKVVMEECDDDMDFYDESVSSQTPPVPINLEAAEVNDTARSSVSYDVLHKHSVPNSNDPIRMTLAVISLTPEITYSARPSMAEVVYANLSTTNSSNYLMMPGEANVFVDGQFVTKTTFSRTAPKAAIKVGLGCENGVTVNYKHLREHVSELGGILQTKKYKREYNRQFTLKNMKDVPITVRVEHEVPTAEDTRIETAIIEPAGIPANDIKDGKMVLNLTLKPREEKKVNVTLTVAYPMDLAVEGL